MSTRRNFIASTAVLAGAFVTLIAPYFSPAFAQSWPQKPVTIVVPFAPGGNTDGIARLAAQRLTETFGKQFIVENRGGASGAIAAEQILRADADGYTLFVAALPVMAIVPAMNKVKYDPIKDFAPISNIATNPFVLVVNEAFPAKTLPEFIAHVKSQNGKLSYASAGTGSLTHLSMALFLKQAGIEMIHVGYRGNAPALADVIAGHVPAMFSNLADVLPQMSTGKLRLLAVSSEKRVSQAPDVPTVAESGYPKFKTQTWNGLLARKGTPQDVIDKVAQEMAKAAKDPKFIERLAGFGADAQGNTPQEFAKMIADDVVLWAEAVEVAGVKQQ
jgi:tripartite-type tricarboxylate transporter receptor subunit TctC